MLIFFVVFLYSNVNYNYGTVWREVCCQMDEAQPGESGIARMTWYRQEEAEGMCVQ